MTLQKPSVSQKPVTPIQSSKQTQQTAEQQTAEPKEADVWKNPAKMLSSWTYFVRGRRVHAAAKAQSLYVFHKCFLVEDKTHGLNSGLETETGSASGAGEGNTGGRGQKIFRRKSGRNG